VPACVAERSASLRGRTQWQPSTGEDGGVDTDLALVGPSLVLRPPGAADVESFWQAVTESVSELSQWMAWCHEDYSREEARAWLETCAGAWDRAEAFDFLTTDRSTGAVLGACALNHLDHGNRRANLGYWVRTGATGRGVATEAAALAVHYGLGDLGLGRVEIVAAVGNRASQRVAEKLGATREGVLRNRFWLRGAYVDAVLFSLLPADLEVSGDGTRGGPG
jgi:ribosomal-protein-serine acetyltransferase